MTGCRQRVLFRGGPLLHRRRRFLGTRPTTKLSTTEKLTLLLPRCSRAYKQSQQTSSYSLFDLDRLGSTKGAACSRRCSIRRSPSLFAAVIPGPFTFPRSTLKAATRVSRGALLVFFRE